MTEDGLSAGAVARRLGVAVTTLRTWHQRYGLGPNGHVAGLHRRYTEEDIARLEVMRQLTTRGVPAAEAARLAQSGSWTELASPAFLNSIKPRPARRGGGHTVPVGRAGAAAHGLARAATRLDSPMMVRTICDAIEKNGVVHTWDTMLRPVLVTIGASHAATGRLIEVEHLLSRSISEALTTAPRQRGLASPRVLLACAAEEQHSLPLEALAAALCERGVSSRLLGPRVPRSALLEAVWRTGPAVLVVWSQIRSTGQSNQLRPILERPRRPAVVMAAGPGWPAELPSTVDRPGSLGEAVSRTLDAAT